MRNQTHGGVCVVLLFLSSWKHVLLSLLGYIMDTIFIFFQDIQKWWQRMKLSFISISVVLT